MRFIEIKEGLGIFIYKKSAINAPQQEIKESIILMLKRANLFN